MVKQAWLQARNNKINTALYITGVALAVAMVMTLAIIWHVKLSPMYPEYERSRIAMVKYATWKTQYQGNEVDMNGALAYGCTADWIDDIQSAEAVCAASDAPKQVRINLPGSNDFIKREMLNVIAGFFKVFNYEFLAGHPFSPDDMESPSIMAIIDDEVAQRFFGSPEAAIGQEIEIDLCRCRVKGVVKRGSYLMKNSYGAAFLPINKSNSYFDNDSKHILFYLIKEGCTIDDLRTEVRDKVRKSQFIMYGAPRYDYNIGNQPILLNDAYFTTKEKMLSFDDADTELPLSPKAYLLIAIVLLLVPALNLIGLNIESINKRSAEIGVRKSFGASRTSLLFEIVGENFALTLVGAIIGLIITWIVILASGNWVFTITDKVVGRLHDESPYISWEMLFSWRVFAIALAATLILNIVSSVVPAWRALRHPIVDSLSQKTESSGASSWFGKYVRYQWIAIELVLICLLAWRVADPLIVRETDLARPVGYEPDQIVEIVLESYGPDSEYFDEKIRDTQYAYDAVQRIKSKIMKHAEVENAIVIMSYYDLEGAGGLSMPVHTDGDSAVAMFSTVFNDDYFSTFGLEGYAGTSIDHLDTRSYAEGECVITKHLANELFGTTDCVGRSFSTAYTQDAFTVVGVIEDVRQKKADPNTNLIITMTEFNSPGMLMQLPFSGLNLVIKLKPGIDPNEFIEDNYKAFNDELTESNFYFSDMTPYSKRQTTNLEKFGITNALRIYYVMLVFLLMNVLLGVVGTMYLQTKRKIHEAGIRKSFGASNGVIIRMYMMQGAVLAFATWAVASLIHLNIALKDGLTESFTDGKAVAPADIWPQQFWLHFSIVAVAILVLIMVAVLIGIYIPARKIGKVPPIDALKEE